MGPDFPWGTRKVALLYANLIAADDLGDAIFGPGEVYLDMIADR
jgi:hypothetical protein